jgi:hypothetical protein
MSTLPEKKPLRDTSTVDLSVRLNMLKSSLSVLDRERNLLIIQKKAIRDELKRRR